MRRLPRLATFAAAALLALPVAARAQPPDAKASARPTQSLTGDDPCSLVEGVPGPGAPIRRAPEFAAAFRALAHAGSNHARLARVRHDLLEALSRLLRESTRVFALRHDAHGRPSKKGHAWNNADREAARHFLERYVLTRHPVLRIGHFGFEPVPGLRAALMWTACRSGDRAAAIRYGRRATTEDEGSARAFAALLLLADGQRAQAEALAPTLHGDDFLVAWVRSELTTDPNLRIHYHTLAVRRVSTPAQHRAVQVQAARMAAEAKRPAKAAKPATSPAGPKAKGAPTTRPARRDAGGTR